MTAMLPAHSVTDLGGHDTRLCTSALRVEIESLLQIIMATRALVTIQVTSPGGAEADG